MSDYANDLVNYRIGPARLTQFRHQDRLSHKKTQLLSFFQITPTTSIRLMESAMITSRVGRLLAKRIWVIMLGMFIWILPWWNLGHLTQLIRLQMTGRYSQKLFHRKGLNMAHVDIKQNLVTRDTVATSWSRSASNCESNIKLSTIFNLNFQHMKQSNWIDVNTTLLFFEQTFLNIPIDSFVLMRIRQVF